MLTNAQRTHAQFGQSIWYDNLQRSQLQDGEFTRLVASGVRGCTTNPTIFRNAIVGSSDYDASLRGLAREGLSAEEIYVKLVVADVRQACDALRAVYEDSSCEDGYVSLEVSPRVSHDSVATVREALELSAAVGRDNLMIKVPATAAGAVALTELIAQGISVNATLLFSGEQYRAIAEAYIAGLERAAAAGINLRKIASVASFFVSRVDAVADAWLSSEPRASAPEGKKLLGQVAIANARLAFAESLDIFGSERFKALEAKGGRIQRLLWASTGTKNPKYADTTYVDQLIGQGTVNTVPPATLSAFQHHGNPQASLATNLDAARQTIGTLVRLGFDLDGACEGLQRDGLTSFTEAMDALIASVATRRQEALASDTVGVSGR